MIGLHENFDIFLSQDEITILSVFCFKIKLLCLKNNLRTYSYRLLLPARNWSFQIFSFQTLKHIIQVKKLKNYIKINVVNTKFLIQSFWQIQTAQEAFNLVVGKTWTRTVNISEIPKVPFSSFPCFLKTKKIINTLMASCLISQKSRIKQDTLQKCRK